MKSLNRSIFGECFIKFYKVYQFMSKVVSFKAPEDMIEDLDKSVEDGNFTSRGELLRSLVRSTENKKLSEKARKDIEEARDQKGRPLDEL